MYVIVIKSIEVLEILLAKISFSYYFFNRVIKILKMVEEVQKKNFFYKFR